MSQAQTGQKLVPLKKEALTKDRLKDYAFASGDFNPIHLEDDFAQDAGFPSVIAHGMLSMSFLGEMIAANFPDDKYFVESFRTRFRKVTFPGDILTCEGEIKKVEESGKLVLALRVKNQSGEVTADGESVVRVL